MIRKLLSLALISFVSLPVHAERGGWQGSGGEVFRFAKNPWFVKNTSTVDYCVVIDQASISADEATIKDVIKEAIAYWKKELYQPLPNPANGFAQLATQTFSEVSTCEDDTPLRFQFGYGTLNEKEIEFLEDPRKFIGVSVRKEYDNEHLKGKGFVFISSDMGPRAYDTLPNTGHLVPKAWQKRKLLLYAVIHELGHVFGIPHTGVGVMSEVFLDQLLHNSFHQFYLDHPLQTFITPPLSFEVCMLNGSFNASYFKVPVDTACLKLEGKLSAGQYEWEISARKSGPTAPTVVGSLRASPISSLQLGAKPAVIVHLPPEQKVFTLQERFVNTFMIGPVFTEGSATGIYKTSTSHRPFDVQVELRADSIVMTGLVSGRMEPVLVYRPPNLLNVIMGPMGF